MNTHRFRSTIRARPLALSMIVALLGACGGGGGNGDAPAPAADTAAPTVSLSSLPASVSRTVTVEAAASDNVGVTQVEFRVDGTAIGTDTNAPFTASWNTGSAAEGSHTLTAVARDAAGNTATSAAVNVEVRNQRQFAVALTGEQENPAVETQGAGTGQFAVNLISGAITGEIAVSGFAATAAHIHSGHAGVNGAVVVGLEQDGANPARWQVPANAVLSSENIDRLLAGALYVNAHSSAHPGGEVRAQILPENMRVFFSDLSAREEPSLIAAAGSARGALTVNMDSRAIVAHLNLSGIDAATDAHIHQGFAGVNGPVSVGLTRDPADPNHFFVENATLSQAAFDALLAGGLYFNVHTDQNPAGHVRGQIVPPDVEVMIADMTGQQQVPAVASTARGRAAVTFNRNTRAIQIHVNSQGLDGATAAHLHRGVAGTNGPVVVGLMQDGSAPGHWFAENATLSPEDAAALLAARTYVNLHSPAHPDGELRAQVVPSHMRLTFTDLTGAEEVPPVTTAASARAATTVDLNARTVTIHVNATGLDDATAAHIHVAPSGEIGPVVVGLTQDPGAPSHWSATDAQVTESQLADYLAGRWYVNVHTPDHPDGEVRGQIVHTSAPSDTQAPSVTLGNVPSSVSGTVTLSATASDDVGVTLVRFRVNGNVVGSDSTSPYSIDWNSSTVGNGQVTIVAEAMDTAGNVGASAAVNATVSNGTGVQRFTFAELQEQVFNVSCAVSGCHSGPSSPQGLDLRAGVSHGNLVGVASGEVPSLMRVNPGNANDSYLIRKLEGGPGIVGQRMPLGGPYLSQEVIDRIRAWIDAGAPNDDEGAPNY